MLGSLDGMWKNRGENYEQRKDCRLNPVAPVYFFRYVIGRVSGDLVARGGTRARGNLSWGHRQVLSCTPIVLSNGLHRCCTPDNWRGTNLLESSFERIASQKLDGSDAHD